MIDGKEIAIISCFDISYTDKENNKFELYNAQYNNITNHFDFKHHAWNKNNPLVYLIK